MRETADVVVIGAGAAGLMAATRAGRVGPGRRILALDGSRKLGAKILIAGGGRCNVTHDHVDESAFAGSSPKAIRKVLGRFGVADTIRFFAERGVEMKREETGKLFPTTDRARTVLDALLSAAREAGVEIRHPCRVETVRRDEGGYVVAGPWGEVAAARIVLSTGGRSVPETGSDGQGYELARALGHSVTRLLPALVPLLLPDGHHVRTLPGLTVPASFEVRSGSGKRLAAFTDSTLCTHFGLSGPSVLDVSRYWLDARADDPATTLVVNWLPGETVESVDALLRDLGRATPSGRLHERLPVRLARALCEAAGVEGALPGHQFSREGRRALARIVAQDVLPISGDRGFRVAEVTAGGVPLAEVRLETMESRVSPGLFFCGEVLDVDGRIGGYNFQWAWASGHVAGSAAGA